MGFSMGYIRPGKHTNIAIENGDLVRGFSQL